MLCATHAGRIEDALSRFQQGEQRAFHELVAIAYDWLGGRIVRMLRDYPTVTLPADEVLHEHVFARLQTALRTQQPRTCDEVTRLAGATIRWALRDIVRQRRQAAPTALDTVAEDAPCPAEELSDAGDRGRFHEAAAALPEPLRRVFCLRYYAGLSEAEAAADLKVSERTLRKHWRQAIDTLSIALTGKPFAGDLPRLRRQGPPEGSPLCGCPEQE